MTTITTILSNLASASFQALAGDGAQAGPACSDIADLGRFIAC